MVVHGGGVVGVAGRPDLTVVEPFAVAPSAHEVALGAAYSHGDSRSRRNLSVDLAALLQLVAVGELDPMIVKTVALADVPRALAQIAARHVAGKICVDLR